MTQWTEKYRPKFFVDIRGQNLAVEKIREFIRNKNREKNSIILHGPPGTGKTALAYVTANETNSELFELNASDLRNKDKLKEILKPAVEQKSLDKKEKIILIDEVDGISEVDRGGLTELLSILEETSIPIIITANNIWDKQFTPLRRISELIQLKEIDYKTIKDTLIFILRKKKNLLTTIFLQIFPSGQRGICVLQ